MVAAFLVTWLVTDLLHVRRTPYIAVLSVVAGGLTVGFLLWSRAGADFWTHSWGWGIVGAVLASALSLVIVRRRIPRIARQKKLAGPAVWEGVVYGAAEGVLLSVLPIAIAWQALRSLGWASVPAATVAVLASVVLVVVHHLGYWEFRGPLMKYAVIMCTGLSVAYVLTGNPMTPIVGHIVLHVAMLQRGVELPPHVRPAPLAVVARAA